MTAKLKSQNLVWDDPAKYNLGHGADGRLMVIDVDAVRKMTSAEMSRDVKTAPTPAGSLVTTTANRVKIGDILGGVPRGSSRPGLSGRILKT